MESNVVKDDFFDVSSEDNIDFEFNLNSNILPEMEISDKSPEPINVYPSILDKELSELESMDIEELRSIFFDEINSLKELDLKERNAQLQYIFSKLFEIQPSRPVIHDVDFLDHEHRLYADLISTPGLSEIDYVIDFLKNKFVSSSLSNRKKDLLLSIFEYYSNHSKQAVDTFNYIYRSSDVLGDMLMNKPKYLDYYFSERVLSSLDKSDLSLLFTFYYGYGYGINIIEKLVSPSYAKALFIISQMTKKVKSLTGHSSEFLESALDLFNMNGFGELLNDVYDKVVINRSNEKSFELTYSTCDDFIIMQELINYVSSYKYDNFYIDGISRNCNMERFLEAIDNWRIRNYNSIFKIGCIDKIKDGTFDEKTDFKSIDTSIALLEFKSAILYNFYGISLGFASHLNERYGIYIDDLEKSILEKDLPIFQLLKSITDIVNLNHDNFQEKLDILRTACLEQIKEKGLDNRNIQSSAIVIEGLLNRMYMNTYNKILTKVSDKQKIIKYDGDVPLLDAGVDFNFIVTSLNGVRNFFDSNVNMASKWNTAAKSNSQGLCASFINNENLGIISLTAPILGFADIPESTLNVMGNSDVFTHTNDYSLRRVNSSRDSRNKYFIPGNIMADETRYGYNEILIDRYNTSDEKGDFKLQPSYVVFYKFDDLDYKVSRYYKESLKVAKDLGIPIMVIDVPKVKEHEQSVIKNMEEELFFSNKSNKELMQEIMTRYMNNHTGSLTMIGEQFCKEDFSGLGILGFIVRLKNHISSIEDDYQKVKWISDFESVYLKEKKKYDSISSIKNWNCSVTEFNLDETYLLPSVIEELKEKVGISNYESLLESITKNEKNENSNSTQFIMENDKMSIFLTDESYTPVISSIVNLVKSLNMGTSFMVVEYVHNGDYGNLITSIVNDDEEKLLVENLMCSYFLGSSDVFPIDSLIDSDFKVDVGFFLEDDLDKSTVINISKQDKLKYYNPELVEKVVLKIENMREDKFLKIFDPIIQTMSEIEGESSKVIEENYENFIQIFLDKKNNIRNVFENLNKEVVAFNSIDINTKNSEEVIYSNKKNVK